LSAVIPIRITNTTENAPISAKYDCRVKAAYHKDLMYIGLFTNNLMYIEPVYVMGSSRYKSLVYFIAVLEFLSAYRK
jgi:hypothetical protein